MSSPQLGFIYPFTANEGLFYNYVDQLNASWAWDNPPEDAASLELILWAAGQSNSTQVREQQHKRLSFTGSTLVPLNYSDFQYPADAHLNLFIRYNNGTTVSGPNSQAFQIKQQDTQGPVCQNCTASSGGPAGAAEPVQPDVAVNALSTAMATAGPTSAPSAAAASSPSMSSAPSSSPSPMGISSNLGAIAGIVVGAGVFLALLGALIYVLVQKRRKQWKLSGIRRPSLKPLMPSLKRSQLSDLSAPSPRLYGVIRSDTGSSTSSTNSTTGLVQKGSVEAGVDYTKKELPPAPELPGLYEIGSYTPGRFD